jgi:hypothetical protein
MQLRDARVCLDCEEVHDAQQCPACASETFAFMTRWVPARARRGRQRPPESPRHSEELEAYRDLLEPDRKPVGWKVLGSSAVGLAAFGLAGWMWRRNGPTTQTPSTPGETAAKPATDRTPDT